MRAREPDEQGHVERGGVRIGYETFGFDGPDAATRPTVVFVPIDTIVHSRAWKGQVPYLAQHYRVVTIDPRGNGRTDRPTYSSAYDDLEFVADTVAVMDHLQLERATLVGICLSAWHAILVAHLHPGRVDGIVAVAPWVKDSTPPHRWRLEAQEGFEEERESYEGWALTNRHVWRDNWAAFPRFFFDQMLPEPHSTKQLEDVVGFACETTGETMLTAEDGAYFPETVEEGEQIMSGLTAPVLVVRGTDDRCQPPGRADTLVRLTGGEQLVIEGAGHLPMARHPVAVSRAIRRFVDRVHGFPAPPRPRRRRRPRVLYLSSPIGLGHVRRDLAVADAMRQQDPDLEVEWLTQSPVAAFLEQRGEVVHPASRLLASESGHFEAESGEHDLHAFDAVRRMDEVLVNNFMVFDDLVEREAYDLWIGDEAWDLDHFLHEHPDLKRAPFVWMTDFVGWVPMPEGGEREALLTADYNAEMVEHVARTPSLRDRSVFVGDPGDVVDLPLGPGLPTARSWTEEHFDFAGYVMGDRPDPARRGELRERFGWTDDDVVCVVSVGGSGVGHHLLRRVAAAYAPARQRVPGLRMVVVAGPRIDPGALDLPDGVEVHGFVPDLDLHHAACDIAVVQGGLSTTMELTAARRPFLYVPLGRHFEQQVHVRHRLDRHRAGRPLAYAEADPDRIAEELAACLAQPVDYLPVPSDGAARAARLALEAL
ncbi:pimeloyl-ACP methyl ester carboxylesterase/predicted glycosyltransferase [Nocardioides cavernae]|uniref:alpha/beta fold hydrolase n=1 Tax=Nocardioides cavernae TaxID=1921566 RepID=UPI0027DDEC5F|nr:alpha/beta fold hydrolase [Nocardioides cavernae]MBM7513571.1 pimeloyl-ACP methyl ester carboxylesterase/predicted glycosyltransferase [Nocardioides cavernae]